MNINFEDEFLNSINNFNVKDKYLDEYLKNTRHNLLLFNTLNDEYQLLQNNHIVDGNKHFYQFIDTIKRDALQYKIKQLILKQRKLYNNFTHYYKTSVTQNNTPVSTSTGSTAVGHQALTASTAAQNTAVGYLSGNSVNSGTSNVFLGSQAGSSLTTGSNNTILGYNSNASAVGGTFQICIGSGIVGQGDSYVTLGSNTAKIYNQFSTNATWTQTSDGRLKTNINDDSLGLSFINRLRPVTFNWKPSDEIDPALPYYNEVNQRNTTTVIHGLIAQEVKAALDAEGCSTFNGWDAGNEDTIQAISREMFISPLIKAIQELSAANEALTARIAALEAK